jgi:hypothetical protein
MISEDDIFAALRAFLLSVLPAGTEVLVTQQNRVPQPVGPNYVMMTAASRTFMSSSYREYRPPDDQQDTARSTSAGIQLDFYGPVSSDYAQRFATLFRDEYATTAMAGTGVTPLYCDDGSQMPLTNGEKQYEARWMIQCALQVNPVVSTPMQFADKVVATIVEAD